MSDVPSKLSSALEGRYAIERELGAGGMATVYLAQDLRHNRRVAVKALRPELAAVIGGERFLKEIEVTANLQHPHILPLFDSGEADTFLYYVMPYVEGESLRARLDREKQLSIDEAIRIATEIASALDYAHRQGVVHRDIKPENILLHDGQALVADFGIALAVSAAGGARITETGLSLGTPQYMSPEQATADRELDPRSDVYSLAAVLYEMLTGEPPHAGNTAQAVIAAVVTEEPRPVTQRRKTVPPHIDAAVHRALQKLPADRFESAAELSHALTTPGAASVPIRVAGGPAAPPRSTALRFGWPGVSAAMAVALAAVLLIRPAPEPPNIMRFVVKTPEFILQRTGYDALALSPDGKRIAYVGVDEGGTPVVFERRLEAMAASPVPNTDGAEGLRFGPDGQSVAVLVAGEIRRVSLEGGSSVTLARQAQSAGVWATDDFVYYTDQLGRSVRVSASGGSAIALEMEDLGNVSWRHVIPELGVAIVSRRLGGVIGAIDSIYAVSLDDAWRHVLVDGIDAQYLDSGHLVFLKGDGSLHVAEVKLTEPSSVGASVQVAENVLIAGASSGVWAVAGGGVLAYQQDLNAEREVLVVDRDGNQSPTGIRLVSDYGLRLSPDGGYVAINGTEPGFDIWVYSLANRTGTRLTFDGNNTYPVWAPDGRRVAFYSTGDLDFDLMWKASDGSGTEEVLLSAPGQQVEVAFTPDGRQVVVREGDRSQLTNANLAVYDVGDPGSRRPLVETEANTRSPAVSPDGRWVAYVSDEAGRDEVYVRPLDGSDTQWQVSQRGGEEPVWAHSGRELFFREGSALMAVGVQLEPTFSITTTPTRLFSVGGYTTNLNHAGYSVTSDDQSFVFMSVGARDEIVFVVNWFEEVRERLATARE